MNEEWIQHRNNSKYYHEMQQLALNLVHYFKMNDTPDEEKYQGNYNVTYLIENMTKENFYFIVSKFLRNIPLGDLKEIINKNFTIMKFDNLLDDEKRNLIDILVDVKTSSTTKEKHKETAGNILKLFQIKEL